MQPIQPITYIEVAISGFAVCGGAGALLYAWARHKWQPLVLYGLISFLISAYAGLIAIHNITYDASAVVKLTKEFDIVSLAMIVLLPFLYKGMVRTRINLADLCVTIFGLFLAFVALLRPSGLSWNYLVSIDTLDFGWLGTQSLPIGERGNWQIVFHLYLLSVCIYCVFIAWREWRTRHGSIYLVVILPVSLIMVTLYTLGISRHLWNGPIMIHFGLLLIYFGLGLVIFNRERQLHQEFLNSQADRIATSDILARLGETHRAIVENLADVVMRFIRRPDGAFEHVFVNHKVLDDVNIPPEKFLGKTHAEMGFPPELVSVLEAALEKTYSTGQKHQIEFMLPDGKWKEWLLAPEFKPNGEVAAIITSARDITGRKQSEALFHQIFKSAGNAMLLMMGDVFIACNEAAERLFGHSGNQILKKTYYELSPPRQLSGQDSRGKGDELIKRAQSGEVVVFNWEHLGPNGEIIFVEITLSLVQGSEPMMLAILRDVKQVTVHRKKLEQAEKMKAIADMVGHVAHDFNNILSVIFGCAEILRQKENIQGDELHLVDNILNAAEKAKELIKKLLLFSRQADMQKSHIEINQLIGDLRDMLKLLAGDDVLLNLSLSTEMVVSADAGSLERVITNLVKNASDALRSKSGIRSIDIFISRAYLDEHRAIASGLAKQGPYIVIEVKDNGQGIESEIVDRIFEPFFTTKGRGGGTGLGLGVCLGIIHDHGGAITVSSKPGAGSSFKLYLPEVSKAAVEPLKKMVVEAPGGTERVLIVEDNSDLLKITQSILEHVGYSVFTAKNGKEALQVLGTQEVDLILTDLSMPMVGGKELCEKVRVVAPDVICLFMTAHTDDAKFVSEARRNGVLLYKPVSRVDLLLKIRQLLDEKGGK